MAVLTSQLDRDSDEFSRRHERMAALVSELRERTAQVAQGGGDAAVERHRLRGKLTARERIDRLVDPDTAFLELNALAAWELYDGDAPSAGIVTGIGVVEGRECVIVANDATVKGGSYFPLTVKKHLRAQEVAEQNGLPCLYLVDSGGAYLPLQAEVFPDRDHFGRIFFNQAQMSAKGIPQIAAVMGSCTAGGAYVPAMSDETIIVRGTGTIFIGGPPLVKAATGQDVTAEELGGADVHARRSGVADHYAASDEHALALARDIVRNLHTRRPEPPWDLAEPEPPALDPAELYGLVPEDFRHQVDARELIARLVDGDQLFGDMSEGNGDPTLTQFGEKATPNQHALATQFGLYDNVYDIGTNSSEGHNWLMQGDNPEYSESDAGEYQRTYDTEEDVLGHQRSGFLWTAVESAGATARNYGEFEYLEGKPSGTWQQYYCATKSVESGGDPAQLTAAGLKGSYGSAIPSLNAIADPLSPPFDLSIPDIYRAQIWQQDFEKNGPAGLNMIWLSSDHTGGPTPRPGWPTTTSPPVRSSTRSRTASTGRTPPSSSSRTTARTAPTTSTATAPRSRSSAPGPSTAR